MSDKTTYEVYDEDREVVGEVRRIFYAGDGWMWRAWAIAEDERGYREIKLSLHSSPSDAEAVIRAYWGMVG